MGILDDIQFEAFQVETLERLKVIEARLEVLENPIDDEVNELGLNRLEGERAEDLQRKHQEATVAMSSPILPDDPENIQETHR